MSQAWRSRAENHQTRRYGWHVRFYGLLHPLRWRRLKRTRQKYQYLHS